MTKDSYAYMDSWWFALLPQRWKEKVMARHYFRTAGSPTLTPDQRKSWRIFRGYYER